MDAILVVAGTLRAIGDDTAAAAPAGTQAIPLLGRGCLLGGRHVDRCYEIIPATRFEWRRALVLVVAATSGSGSREDQIVQRTRITTRRRLSSRVQSLILLQLIWRQPGQAMVIVWGLLTGLVSLLGAVRLSIYVWMGVGTLSQWRSFFQIIIYLIL